MRVLSIVHQEDAASGVFRDAVEERDGELVEWAISNGSAPPAPPESFDAVIVFGGAMHVDQERQHSWLRDEDALLRGLLERRKPVLGVCLGGQLVAKALGARVSRLPRAQIGWFEVEQTPEAADDPVFSQLPQRFLSLQWHLYAFDLPPGATPLARDTICLQAYRAGDTTWGIQFHPEVTRETVDDWFRNSQPEAPADIDAIRRQTEDSIAAWNDFGKRLCGAFVDVATAS